MTVGANPPEAPSSLDAVRAEIDRLDAEIVGLLAERARMVGLASGFKRTEAEAAAPERARAVIERVRRLAETEGLDADLVEALYRLMIERFVAAERVAIRGRTSTPR
jgi:isochorismate pyruvate lyase